MIINVLSQMVLVLQKTQNLVAQLCPDVVVGHIGSQQSKLRGLIFLTSWNQWNDIAKYGSENVGELKFWPWWSTGLWEKWHVWVSTWENHQSCTGQSNKLIILVNWSVWSKELPEKSTFVQVSTVETCHTSVFCRKWNKTKLPWNFNWPVENQHSKNFS